MSRESREVRLERVSKRFGATVAVNDVSIAFIPGEIHALVGENGAGKSTVVKMLSAVIQPTSGKVIVGERESLDSPAEAIEAGVATTYQDRALVPQLTVAQNIGLGHERDVGRVIIGARRQREVARRALAAIELELNPDMTVGQLALADQQLVAIAKALAQDAHLLILDEPTAALTGYEADRLIKTLREISASGTTVLYVSHRLAEITALADRVTVLKDGELQVTMPIEQATEQVIMRHMIGRDLGDLYPERSVPEERAVLCVDQVTASTGSFREISFELHAGEILGVAGLEGSGKEALADALAGGSTLSSGTVTVAGRSLRSGSVGRAQSVGLGYVPPDRKHQALFENLQVSEGITLAALERYTKMGLIRKRAARSSARELADQVRVHGNIDGPPSGLSGGNQQKTVLARVLCREANVMVLAEPTSGVDVGAKAEIYRILAELARSGAAIVIVSSEMTELLGCCHRILVMREGEVTAEFPAEAATEEAILVAQLPASSARGANGAEDEPESDESER